MNLGLERHNSARVHGHRPRTAPTRNAHALASWNQNVSHQSKETHPISTAIYSANMYRVSISCNYSSKL